MVNSIGCKDIDLFLSSPTQEKYVLRMSEDYKQISFVPLKKVAFYEVVAAWFGFGPISLINIFTFLKDNDKAIINVDKEKQRKFYDLLCKKVAKHGDNRWIRYINMLDLLNFSNKHCSGNNEKINLNLISNDTLLSEDLLLRAFEEAKGLKDKRKCEEASKIFQKCISFFSQKAENEKTFSSKMKVKKVLWSAYAQIEDCYRILGDEVSYLKYLCAEAETGNPEAMRELCCHYFNKDDYKEAAKWKRQAIDCYLNLVLNYELANDNKQYLIYRKMFLNNLNHFVTDTRLYIDQPIEQRVKDYCNLIDYNENAVEAIKWAIEAKKIDEKAGQKKLTVLLEDSNQFSANELEEIGHLLLNGNLNAKADEYLWAAARLYSSDTDKIRCYKFLNEKWNLDEIRLEKNILTDDDSYCQDLTPLPNILTCCFKSGANGGKLLSKIFQRKGFSSDRIEWEKLTKEMQGKICEIFAAQTEIAPLIRQSLYGQAGQCYTVAKNRKKANECFTNQEELKNKKIK